MCRVSQFHDMKKNIEQDLIKPAISHDDSGCLRSCFQGEEWLNEDVRAREVEVHDPMQSAPYSWHNIFAYFHIEAAIHHSTIPLGPSSRTKPYFKVPSDFFAEGNSPRR